MPTPPAGDPKFDCVFELRLRSIEERAIWRNRNGDKQTFVVEIVDGRKRP